MSDRPPCCAPVVVPSSKAAGASRVSQRDDDLTAAPATRSTRGQIRLDGGSFSMGDHFDEGYVDDGETPVHLVHLSPYYIDPTPVTNAQFASFTRATDYVTEAERLGVSAVFHLAFSGAHDDVVHQVAAAPWWLAVRGANWRQPEGPGTNIVHRQNHPVVHVTWHDADAYCRWAGKSLPTEAQWEYAARGGLEGARFAWGDELTPRSRWQCNIWQGVFPRENTVEDGYLTTAPVKTFAPNGHGLWQTAGNVWEWCSDWFSNEYYKTSTAADPRGPTEGDAKVMRGGSYLCHASYCHRYRVAARSRSTPDSASANVGFRCANPSTP